jgi:16S rRNA (guanine527-N7)-methyltransferase
MYFEKRIPVILDLGFSAKQMSALKRYVDLLWASNEELNLISRKMSFEELIDNHVIDCLLPLKKFPADVRAIADFGSGGGLPGVVYAIQFPERKFHLYEKSPLKRDFLAKCKPIAPNIEIFGEIPNDLKGVDLVVARGFKPLDVILDVSRTYYQSGGKYFLLKARREKIDEEIALAKKKFKTFEPQIERLSSPVLEVERHLVTF